MDMGAYGGHCQHQYTNQTRDINKTNWDKERVGMFCTTSQGFTDLVTPIDQFCAISKDACEYKTREPKEQSLIDQMNSQKAK